MTNLVTKSIRLVQSIWILFDIGISLSFVVMSSSDSNGRSGDTSARRFPKLISSAISVGPYLSQISGMNIKINDTIKVF
jgi:hypothetical protein